MSIRSFSRPSSLLAALLLTVGCDGSTPLQPLVEDQAGFSIAPAEITLLVGQEKQLFTNLVDSSAGAQPPSGAIHWNTSDSRIAVVRENGIVVPTAPGRVVVEALYNGMRAATTVLVVTPPACGVANPSSALTLELAVGESRILSGAEAACLRLKDAPGSRYALAYADLRNVVRAERGTEQVTDTDIELRIGYLGTPQAAANRIPMGEVGAAEVSSPAPDLVLASGARGPRFGSAPIARSRVSSANWVEGETLTFQGGQDVSRRIHIERVYAGYYVLGFDEETRASFDSRQLAVVDSAFRILVESGDPILGSLTQRRPSSVAGTEKMMVVFTRRADAAGVRGMSYAHAVPSGERVTSHVTISLGAGAARTAELVSLLAHELAHTRQHEHMSATSPSGGTPSAYFPWAAEGGADLIAQEVVREHLGIRPLQPLTLDDRLDTAAQQRFYYSVGALARGSIGAGYNDAAGFLRYLVEARVQRGEAYEQALAEVVTGAVEGLYGFDSKGVRRTGLASRMRSRLGPSWNPGDAMLRYALALAVDELTADPSLQSLSFSGLSGSRYTSRPDYTFSGERSQDARFTRGFQSVGYVFLGSPGPGGVYTASTNAEESGWMLVRYR
jgi:hypothetical protein